MIKYETIISNFDDKVTLYNWLRKVEEALKNASATNFVVNKKGNATLSFSITFADGTTLESGDIVLQQGESVDDARIASGILQLHLTNGTWLTAGNIKPVNNFSIDANQHLIVNYQDGTSQDLGAIFNGNITISGNLNVSGSINGEANPSVKPIYFHPIYARYDDENYGAEINFMILNNDPTPFNATTFVNAIIDLMDNGAFMQANGYVVNKGTLNAFNVFMLSKTAPNTYTFYMNSANGAVTINMAALTLSYVSDGVNKIN